MNTGTLNKVWSALAVLTLCFGINAVADVQGSSFLLPAVIEMADNRGIATRAVSWFLLTVITYWATLYTARLHAERSCSASWIGRWPVMFDLTLDPTDKLAARYQGIWLVLVMLVPLYGAGFTLNEVFELEVSNRKRIESAYSGWANHLTNFRFASDWVVISGEDRRRIKDDKDLTPGAKENALKRADISYYPGFQGWFFIGLLSAAIIECARVVCVLRRVKQTVVPEDTDNPGGGL